MWAQAPWERDGSLQPGVSTSRFGVVVGTAFDSPSRDRQLRKSLLLPPCPHLEVPHGAKGD